jgi:hypothetical protein
MSYLRRLLLGFLNTSRGFDRKVGGGTNNSSIIPKMVHVHKDEDELIQTSSVKEFVENSRSH